MRVVVIMAGGSGTRFWPASRRKNPKQFLPLCSDKPMLIDTVERGQSIPGVEKTYIVAGSDMLPTIEKLTENRPDVEIIAEPAARNTAPCLALAASVIATRHGDDTVMAVLSADHLILDTETFAKNADLAMEHAAEEDALITLGASPTHPDTGFGYLEFGETLVSDGRGRLSHVTAFKEKPDLETAQQYLEKGNYYWNTGMFFWKCATLLAAFEQHSPEISQGIEQIHLALETKQPLETLKGVFEDMPKISIDYAVMEKAHNVHAVAGEFDWDDLGTWDALARTGNLDQDGNLVRGEAVFMDAKGNIVYSVPANRDQKPPLVAALGVENLVIAVTPDGVLVCPRSRVQEVKEILGKIQEKGREDVL